MARPKVHPDKRQRTAIACDCCKRRKQKCNGQQPCNVCTKRRFICTYNTVVGKSADSQSRSERPMLDSFSNSSPGLRDLERPTSVPPIGIVAAVSEDFQSKDNLSGDSNSISGHEEEAVVYSSSRMLQDPSGRLLYIGDAATLSFLQLVRMIVESTSGASPFTLDPRRHWITENTLSLAHDTRTTQLLPSKETAFVLLDSFFDHTCGLVEIFNRCLFQGLVENCYADPLGVESNWLCLLYLVLATGLAFATPEPGTQEDMIIQKLRAEPLDRAEIFYLNAKKLGDPSTFESPCLWSIQALLLMTLYMLATSKRNTAYIYHGMAVRSAFALGMHREESMIIFNSEQQALRRNLWRSLFVIDRFLSVSLGRPASISEADCSDTVLKADGNVPISADLESQGLAACVRCCQFIGLVLEKVYSKRKISTRLGQELADRCTTWSKILDPRLKWEQDPPLPKSQGIAILHVNLFYCHSIILLVRPFFLSVLRKVEQEKLEPNAPTSPRTGSMERFSEACLVASCHSVVLVQNAREARCLSRRDPFVTYFLFSSTLIILCNEYAKLHSSPRSETCIANAIETISFMAEVDPQAQRLQYILQSFHDVVRNRYKEPELELQEPTQIPIPPTIPIETQVPIQTSTASQPLDNANIFDSLFDFQPFPFNTMDANQQIPDQDWAEIDFESLWNWLPAGPQNIDEEELNTGIGKELTENALLYGTSFTGSRGLDSGGSF